jgi:hypothetical protein
MTQQTDNPMRDARAAIIRAIAELKAMNVAVPMALHLAVHALAYAEPDKPGLPACHGQGHAGAFS